MREKKPLRIVLYFESASGWLARNRQRLSYDIADEMAVWLMDDDAVRKIANELTDAAECDVILIEHTNRSELLKYLDQGSIFWNLTDGKWPFHGSNLPALVELFDIPRFGNSAYVQMLGQDKFRFFCICQQLGLNTPRAVLFEGERLLSASFYAASLSVPLFVKPNSLGVSIGINERARVYSLAEAAQQSQWIWNRYGTRAIVQEFISGVHIRAVYVRTDSTANVQECIHLTEVTKMGIAAKLGYIPFTLGAPLEGYKVVQNAKLIEICRNLMVTLIENSEVDDYCATDIIVSADGASYLVDFNACPFLDNESLQQLYNNEHTLGYSFWAAICASYERQNAWTTDSSMSGTLKSQK